MTAPLACVPPAVDAMESAGAVAKSSAGQASASAPQRGSNRKRGQPCWVCTSAWAPGTPTSTVQALHAHRIRLFCQLRNVVCVTTHGQGLPGVTQRNLQWSAPRTRLKTV
jgi:hypothetical protein